MKTFLLALTGLCLGGCLAPVPELVAPPVGDAGPHQVDAGPPDAGVDAGLPPDAGDEWVLQTTLPAHLRSVWVLASGYVWAVGAQNAVYRYNGSQWLSVAPADCGDVSWRDVRGEDDTVWMVGDSATGAVLYDSSSKQRRSIGGSGYTVSEPVLLDAHAAQLWVGGSNSGQGVIVGSKDLGLSWTLETLPACPQVLGGFAEAFEDPGVGVWWAHPTAVVKDGRLLSYQTDGLGAPEHWALSQALFPRLSRPTGAYLETISPDNFTIRGWLGGQQALLFWDGYTWGGAGAVPVAGSPTFAAEAIWADMVNYQPRDLWVVGDQGVILHSTDTTTWSVSASPTHSHLLDVHGDAEYGLWAVADTGEVLHRHPSPPQ